MTCICVFKVSLGLCDCARKSVRAPKARVSSLPFDCANLIIDYSMMQLVKFICLSIEPDRI